MAKVRVGIIGVGNCASSFVQGVEYYKKAAKDDFVPGLMHVDLGGYHISDIEFSAAIDIDKRKVGKDINQFTATVHKNQQVFRLCHLHHRSRCNSESHREPNRHPNHC